VNARQIAVLSGTSLLRGGSYVLIVYALATFGPLALALGQSIVAAVVLLALRPGAAAWRDNRRALPWIAFLQNVAPIALVAAAVAHLDTGVAAILLATTPLLSAALARTTGAADQLTRRQLSGLVVGLAGVAATTGAGTIDSAAEWLAALAVLLAAASYAAAGLLVRRSSIPPTEGACWAFVLSVPMLLPLALLEWSVHAPSARAVIALVVLGAASTGLATVMYFWLIEQAGPARALLVTYLSPLVALGFGAAVLDERLPFLAALGLPLILAGVAIASRA
jgi:drug/metabolite transporter (DMT)-like permease